MLGYYKKKMSVDLTQRKVKISALTDDMLRTFIGGSGLAEKMLYDILMKVSF